MRQRIVHIYVFDSLADWEVGHALAHINNPQFQRQPGRYRVRAVGEQCAPVTTMGGLAIMPELALADVRPADSAMLILPGGMSWDTGANQQAVAKAAEFIAAGVPVAAICGATAGLARAGLLDDRAHTSNARAYLEQTGYAGAANYREQNAVADRGVITAGATAPVAFAAQVFAALELYDDRVLAAWTGLYTTGEARYFFDLLAATGPGTEGTSGP